MRTLTTSFLVLSTVSVTGLLRAEGIAAPAERPGMTKSDAAPVGNPGDTPPAESAPSSEESTSAPETSDAAVEHYHAAEERYLAGDLAGALREMEASYAASGRAELLFNLGQLRREFGDCPRALRDYREYLRRVNDERHRSEALRAVDELGRQCPDSPAPRKRVELQLTPRPEHYWSPVRIAAWSAIGAAVVSGAGATYFAFRAAHEESVLESRIRELQSAPMPPSVYDQNDKAREARGRHAATWARVLGIGAAGFATLGVTLLVVSGRPRQATGSTLAVQYAGGASGVLYSQIF